MFLDEGPVLLTKKSLGMYGLYDAVITYVAIASAGLVVIFAITLYFPAYLTLRASWLFPTAFVGCILMVVTQIWDLFYQRLTITYGYAERPRFQVLWIAVRITMCGVCIWQAWGMWPYVGTVARQLTAADLFVPVTMLILLAVAGLSVAINVLMLWLGKLIDRKAWRDYNARFSSKQPVSFREYCQAKQK